MSDTRRLGAPPPLVCDRATTLGKFAALLPLQNPPKADGIVLTRLTRALTVQEATLAIAGQAGGSVATADSGKVLRDDPSDPMRTALRQVVGVFAELDRRMVVKRLHDGRTAKAAEGRHATGSYTYGYEGAGKGRVREAAPRTDEQAAVARIVELRRAGESYRSIAAPHGLLSETANGPVSWLVGASYTRVGASTICPARFRRLPSAVTLRSPTLRP